MKKIISMTLAALMAVTALAGCGGNGGETQDTGNTLNIGGIGPLTGAAAIYGTAVEKGVKLAIEEVNAAGGVNGMKLAVDFQDDEHDAEKSVNAYNTIKDKSKLLIGTVTSNPCVAVAAETLADNMFMLTPSGSAEECIKNDNAFRICFSDPEQGTIAADYIKKENVASKVAVMYNSSDVYSQGIYEAFAVKAKEVGLEIADVEAFTKDSATDFSVQLQKIADSGAELIFLPMYYQEAALILTQAKKMGLNAKFFGSDGLDGIIDQLGADVKLADGLMFLTPFAAGTTDQKSVDFVAAYKKAYKDEIPNQFAADGYDAVYTVKAALEKAGITDPSIATSDLCDALKTAMTEITVEGVTGTMTWDASGAPTKAPKIVVIKDGAYQEM